MLHPQQQRYAVLETATSVHRARWRIHSGAGWWQWWSVPGKQRSYCLLTKTSDHLRGPTMESQAQLSHLSWGQAILAGPNLPFNRGLLSSCTTKDGQRNLWIETVLPFLRESTCSIESSGVRMPTLKSKLYRLAVWPCPFLTSLSLQVLICKMWMLIIRTSWIVKSQLDNSYRILSMQPSQTLIFLVSNWRVVTLRPCFECKLFLLITSA